MSRKLIFVSGLLSCFSCQLAWPGWADTLVCPGREEECVICLRAFMGRKPLDISRRPPCISLRRTQPKAAQIFAFAEKAVTAYDKFLAFG